MARVVGQSGAWKAITLDLSRRNCTVSHPSDLGSLAERLETARDSDISAHRATTMRSVQERSARIAALGTERGFFRQALNGFKVSAIRSEIANLYAVDACFPARLDERITRVRSLIGSAELAGAEAELSVIAELKRLPDHFIVFNDVRLKATRHIFFNGAALQSAQVDHVVIGPSGVFVIETKCWRRAFVASGAFHDPFDQVARAGYLCYDLLRAYRPIHVRGMIASLGELPPAPSGSRTKVVRPGALARYIKSFAQEVTPERLDGLHAFFAQRVG